MTSEALEAIRKRWLSMRPALAPSATPKTQAAADVAELLAEIERLQFSCDQITRQYARLCQTCGSKQCTSAKRARTA